MVEERVWTVVNRYNPYNPSCAETAMRNIARDLGHSWRRLLSSPLFSIFAVLTLAIGIGATTAIYSIVRAIMAPPPGIADIDEVVGVYHAAEGSIPMIALSWPDYQDFRARQTVFSSVTGWRFFRQTLVANGQTETAFAEMVSGEYFDVLRVMPALGRTLQVADDRPQAPPVAVISHGVWRRLFASAPDVVGRVVKINGHAFEVVGVAPDSFRGLFNGGLTPSALWIPVAAARVLPRSGANFNPESRDHRWLLVKGRLASGRTLTDVRTEVSAIAAALDREFPIGRDVEPRFRTPYRIGRPWHVRRSSDIIVNEAADRLARPLAFTLIGAVGIVLLVACTNLTNLMLARGSARRHEFSVRLALGASRWRLVREASGEAAILVVCGGALSLAVTRGALAALGNELQVGNGAVMRFDPAIDAPVLIASAAASILAMLVAGVVPAWQSTRADVRTALAGADASVAPRWHGRATLIATQVSISVVLLATALLCVSHVRQQSRRDSGMDLERVALVEVDFAQQQYEPSRVRRIVDEILDQLNRQPYVEAAAVSSGLPVGAYTPGASLRPPEGGSPVRVELLASTRDLFAVLGVPIVRGRALDARDTSTAQPAAVISEYAARAVFDTVDVVARQVLFRRSQWVGETATRDQLLTIVGVAADTDTGSIGRRDHGIVYLSFDQHYEGRLVFSARTSSDPAALVGLLRKTLRSVDDEAGVTQAGTGTAITGVPTLFLQVSGGVATVLGGFALLLALAGLYGALSHVVAGRTREIGIRLALGASRPQVMRMVIADGLRPVASGLALGLAIGAIARMAMRPMFVQLLPASDAVALAVAAAGLLAAGLLACFLPARRAANVDPNVALRDL